MKQILCPQCKNTTVFSSENPYRPFCSERCKLIDLGKWADETYRVADEEGDPYSEDVQNEEN